MEFEKLQKKSIRFITYRDPKYPKKLLDMENPPYALYVKGSLPDGNIPAIAIVGARQCSPYGEYYALEYARTLSSAGIQIVSGMARGIDGIAQRGALDGSGRSFGVLACGVDICYPQEHIGLYMDLQEQGGILSEQPIGALPLAFHFPARNRIISGLSDAILIIEAKENSGSLITAHIALEQGKDIYALPGPVDSMLSKGCNQLIKDGAGVLLSPEDLLKELHFFCEKKMEYLKGNKIMLETTENMVYSRLCLQPKNVNQLIEELEIPIPSLMNALISLELMGLIKEITKNYYVKMK
ncbi:MAG: DNA-processing protein DprA [Lachnospiraceae bacterium]